MREEMRNGMIAVAAVGVLTVLVGVSPLLPGNGIDLWDVIQHDEDAEKQPDDPFVHKHAYLFFVFNDTRKHLDDRYIERDPGAHFHHDDGVIHIEGDDANLSEVLDTLKITLNATCVAYNLENETYCAADNTTAVRLNINGEDVGLSKGLNRTIQQDDNIVLFYGNASISIPEKYTERVLRTTPGQAA